MAEIVKTLREMDRATLCAHLAKRPPAERVDAALLCATADDLPTTLAVLRCMAPAERAVAAARPLSQVPLPGIAAHLPYFLLDRFVDRGPAALGTLLALDLAPASPTLLRTAVRGLDVEFEVLLCHGADAAGCVDGRSVLATLAAHNHAPRVRVLLAYGAVGRLAPTLLADALNSLCLLLLRDVRAVRELGPVLAPHLALLLVRGARVGPEAEDLVAGVPACLARGAMQIIRDAAVTADLTLADVPHARPLLWTRPQTCQQHTVHAVRTKDAALLALLLRDGVGCDTAVKGRTLLDIAVAVGDSACTELLLQHGAALRPSALAAAVATYSAESGGLLAILLPRFQGGVNARFGAARSTLLHLAASLPQHAACVAHLLTVGADPAAVDADGNTPLHFAVRCGCESAEACADRTAAVRQMLASGRTLVDKQNDYGGTALAAVNPNCVCAAQVAALLLQNGARADRGPVRSVLPHLVYAGRATVDVVRLLLAAGADIDDTSPHAGGIRPADMLFAEATAAASPEERARHADVLRLLSSRGARVSPQYRAHNRLLYDSVNNILPE